MARTQSSSTKNKGAPAAPKRRTQEERRQATREALLSAAVDVICEVGYASATTNMIADRAGVTRGAMQYHFASRDDLVLAVTDSVMTELNFRLDTARLSALPLEERVEALITQYRAAFSGHLFHAATQILLSARSDPALFARTRMHLKSAQDAINRTWHEIFPELRLSARDLAGLRRITMSAIRGYVVLELFGVAGAWRRDSEILRRMVLGRLAAGMRRR